MKILVHRVLRIYFNLMLSNRHGAFGVKTKGQSSSIRWSSRTLLLQRAIKCYGVCILACSASTKMLQLGHPCQLCFSCSGAAIWTFPCQHNLHSWGKLMRNQAYHVLPLFSLLFPKVIRGKSCKSCACHLRSTWRSWVPDQVGAIYSVAS